MMNTVRKSENLLPFPVISAAANGDTTAMCAILKHYEGYIAKLCTRTLKDDAGNTYSYVDEEMRNRLQVRLITRTLALPRRKTGLAACGRRHTRRHNDTPALNTLKVLRGAPISMGRGETPVRLQLTTARFCLLTNIVYPYRKRRFF